MAGTYFPGFRSRSQPIRGLTQSDSALDFYTGSREVDEIARIRAEYASRAESIPADRYSWDRPEIQFWKQSTARVLKRLLGESDLAGKHIADIGCGDGQWLNEFQTWGAGYLNGIDLLEERISEARQRLPDADLHCGDARCLPWANASMDLVTQFTVFSSILDPQMRSDIANEMRRVLKPGGHIFWYDCRYSNPARAVQGLSRDTIRTLFPNCRIRFATATLFPPLSRVVARRSQSAAAVLEALSFSRTHLAAAIRPAD